MKQFLFAQVLILCLFVNGNGQPKSIKPFSIGDTIPHYILDSFYKEPNQKLDLFKLRGKLVILDFWNVHCKACIASMPKMDSLQKHFGNKIQILLITYNTSEEIEKLFSKIRMIRPNLPIITSRNLYSNYFPHEGDPLHVWVNPDGVVQYMSEAYNSTVDNIQTTLKGNRLSQIQNRQFLQGYDPSGTFLSQASSVLSNNMGCYSLLLQGMHAYQNVRGAGVFVTQDSLTAKAIMVHAFNCSVFELYSFAYCRELFGFEVGNNPLFYNNRICDETGTDIMGPTNKDRIDEWRARNLFSYEAAITSWMHGDIYDFMQMDLNRYFDYVGRIEKRKVKCLVLIRTDTINRIKAKNSLPGRIVFSNGIRIMNLPMSALTRQLIYSLQKLPTPVIDGTNYKGMIDVTLKEDMSDLSSVRKDLQKYGLDLIEQSRDLKMLVLQNRSKLSVSLKQGL